LALYLKKTLPADLTPAAVKLTDDLTRAGKRLKGFCRTNLFKRLESSATAFQLLCSLGLAAGVVAAPLSSLPPTSLFDS
jgi:hypothetical protein